MKIKQKNTKTPFVLNLPHKNELSPNGINNFLQKDKIRTIRRIVKESMCFYKLRAYQIRAIASTLYHFQTSDLTPVILVLPTGAGKSIIISEITKLLNSSVLILQPSKELLEQNFEKYRNYNLPASIYSASKGKKEIGQVTFATIGSIYKKIDIFKEFKYCIIDECHLVNPEKNGMYSRFFSGLKKKIQVIGLTATPIRMKSYLFPYPHSRTLILNQIRPSFFKKIIHITQIREMVDNNYFTPLKYIVKDWDENKLKLTSTGLDYSLDTMRVCFMENKLEDKILKIISFKQIKHFICFVPSVLEAYKLQEKVPWSGVLESNTDKKEREKIIGLFRKGDIRIIFNVNILTLGFDFPALDGVILARPTRSLSLYYQMIGRIVRSCNGKEKAYIFDLVGNVKRFGPIENLIIEKNMGRYKIISGEKILTGEEAVYAKTFLLSPKQKSIFNKNYVKFK